MAHRAHLIIALIAAAAAGVSAQAPADQSLPPVLARMGAYISSYGEKAALVVAVEEYTQTVMFEGAAAPTPPRRLVAEFAIVKTSDGLGWVGFRDVVEVNGSSVADRRDRLRSLFTATGTADATELQRIANESSRFNVGPISRNFNVPTSAMFFFVPDNLARFAFTRKGTKKINGVETWEITFKETRTPTLVMTAAGVDVPVSGTLWVKPDDGTVVRTRLLLKNFADQMTSPVQTAPPEVEPFNPKARRQTVLPTLAWDKIESSGDIEVTYRPHPDLGLWLPSEMAEFYSGPITLRVTPSVGRSTTRAKYSDFKQFGTAAALVVPKQ